MFGDCPTSVSFVPELKNASSRKVMLTHPGSISQVCLAGTVSTPAAVITLHVCLDIRSAADLYLAALSMFRQVVSSV